MGRLKHAWVHQDVRLRLDKLRTVLEQLDRAVVSLEAHTTMQGAIADVQGRLQTVGDLVEHALAGTAAGPGACGV